MLVLTRYVAESIIIGDDIVVTVLRVDGERVRIGVEAPASVPVDRREVRRRKEGGDSGRREGEGRR